MIYQEACTYDADGPACTEWPCSAEGGADAGEAAAPPPSPEAGLDAPNADVSRDVLSPLTTVDATMAMVPDAAAPAACVPDQICDGIATCNDPCYGATCCSLVCSCESPNGGAGVPSDPNAHLACTISCPP